MASILTNTNAMSALQTMRSIASNMEDTQNRISSGLRVGSAKDNAAYWSIATTMRADNSALSTVQDAMGLGAAKVDTASAGMESAIEIVKQIKDKLTTAKETSADKGKIQEEITQLQEQLKSVSQSASFSGENWLQADLSATGTTNTKSVVGSFIRDDQGNVSVKKVDYTLTNDSVLFDTRATGTKTGILDANARSGTSAVNLTEVKIVKDVASTKTADDLIAQGAVYAASGLDVDGNGADFMATFSVGADKYIRKYDGAGVIQTDSNGKELWARVVALDATDPVDAKLIAKSDAANKTTGGAFTDGTDTYYYAEDQVTESKTVTALTKDSILSITGASVSGRVASNVSGDTYIQLDETKDVWVKATAGNATDDLAGIDINGVNYDVDGANKTLPAALAGADLGFSVSDLDVTKLGAVATALGGDQEDALSAMISYVDKAYTSMTSAASKLGSISSRIELQTDFLSKLTDSIDKGVGRLVDADMNEESTRLKALQTQQQLAVQALSIANSDSQNILSLFR